MIVSLAPELLSGYLLALVRAAAWVFVSLPFKLLLFVMVDGWGLIVRSLLKSFA